MPRKYDLEFKLEAVRMASESGITNREVERRLGIGQGDLSRWKRDLKNDGFFQSMSRKGDCWDNAVAESFFGIMKTELVS